MTCRTADVGDSPWRAFHSPWTVASTAAGEERRRGAADLDRQPRGPPDGGTTAPAGPGDGIGPGTSPAAWAPLMVRPLYRCKAWPRPTVRTRRRPRLHGHGQRLRDLDAMLARDGPEDLRADAFVVAVPLAVGGDEEIGRAHV